MKKLMKLVSVVILSLAVLVSCQKDDSLNTTVDGQKVTASVVKSFDKKYPDATNVIWEKKAPYWLAHFDLKGTSSFSSA